MNWYSRHQFEILCQNEFLWINSGKPFISYALALFRIRCSTILRISIFVAEFMAKSSKKEAVVIPADKESIEVFGARVHNLKNIDISGPMPGSLSGIWKDRM